MFVWLTLLFLFSFSHVSFAQEEFISEIINLKNGAQIPNSVFKKYSSVEIARSIVERLRRQGHAPGQIEDQSNFELRMYRSDRRLGHILEYGFRNVHQTYTTSGTDYAEYPQSYMESRLRAEKGLMDLTFSSKLKESEKEVLDELLPKSAFVVPHSSSRPPLMIESSRYGEVVAVFKDHIKERMTWTMGDSLNLSWEGQLKTHTAADSVNAIEVKRPGYIEAQIWGDLGADDVKEWWIPKGASSETLDQLKKMGRPVYEYSPVEKTISFEGVTKTVEATREKGVLLFQPSAEEIAVFEAKQTQRRQKQKAGGVCSIFFNQLKSLLHIRVDTAPGYHGH